MPLQSNLPTDMNKSNLDAHNAIKELKHRGLTADQAEFIIDTIFTSKAEIENSESRMIERADKIQADILQIQHANDNIADSMATQACLITTKAELKADIVNMVTKAALQAEISKLATKDDLKAAVAELKTEIAKSAHNSFVWFATTLVTMLLGVGAIITTIILQT
jgi:hypothetical protein